jgi:iron complex outermembrane recepter protein
LQELMNEPVTTASKSAQSIYDVAAPVYVITARDIQRAGATSIPEALRLAPGVIVNQIDPGKWAVSIRGFAFEYSNKALVLLDGRALYTQLNSSVYWNTMDTVVDDIERIEVIRGPGDARWGSHALNGIVNIITKSSAKTQGALLSTTVDSHNTQILTARYGGELSPQAHWRTYVKDISRGDMAMATESSRLGDFHALRVGGRIDVRHGASDQWMFLADLQQGRDGIGSSLVAGGSATRYDIGEWSALARWHRDPQDGIEQQAQLSWASLDQEIYETRRTLDFAYQAQLREWHAQQVTLGAGYKHTADDIGQVLTTVPDRMTQESYSAFIHDRIALTGKASLLLGSQFEHNVFTGWEAQPSLQWLYKAREERTYWVSLARAVRTPLRLEEGLQLSIPLFPGALVRVSGNRDLKSEEVRSAQAGARLALRHNLWMDVTAFYNRYRDLIETVAQAPVFEPLPPPGNLVFPSMILNAQAFDTWGAELAVEATVNSRWRLTGSYTFYSQPERVDADTSGSYAAMEHQFQLHSSVQLVRKLEWNVDLYRVGALTSGQVPSFYKLDTQFAWRPLEALQLALGVKNSLSPQQREVGVNSVNVPTEIPRSAYLRMSWQF